jgi:hypothetical protein
MGSEMLLAIIIVTRCPNALRLVYSLSHAPLVCLAQWLGLRCPVLQKGGQQ